MTAPSRPDWRLPEGVTRGLWEYAHAPHIADDYDDYFAFNSLFEFDAAVLAERFRAPGLMLDLGCGTGRLLVAMARRGIRGLGVDLSLPMLRVVGEKARTEGLPIERLRANLVELDCLRDDSADYAICMFSTLGMIRGADQRLRVVRHVRRIVKPGGTFILHVHNRWQNLSDPQGRVWVLRNMIESRFRRDIEPGDKFFDYRGIPKMFLHVFTRGELRRLLKAGGFERLEFIPLNTVRRHRLRWPWFFGRLRANGWIIVCQ